MMNDKPRGAPRLWDLLRILAFHLVILWLMTARSLQTYQRERAILMAPIFSTVDRLWTVDSELWNVDCVP